MIFTVIELFPFGEWYPLTVKLMDDCIVFFNFFKHMVFLPQVESDSLVGDALRKMQQKLTSAFTSYI